MALDFDKILASRLPMIEKKMHSQIAKASPMMMQLMKLNKVWDKGGDIIQPHLKKSRSTTNGSYRGYDQFDIAPQDTRTAAKFGMKQMYGNFTISGYDEAADNGELAVFKQLEIAMTDAEEDLKDKFATALFSDGTGNSSKDILGIAAAVDDGTNVALYGGIDRATNIWWKSKYNGATGALTIAKMREMFVSCSRGGNERKPDFIVCDQTTWLYYAQLIDGKTNIQQPLGKLGEQFANLGFASLSFMGIPVVWDEYAPANTMYFLNSNTIQFWTKPGRKFTPTKLKEPIDGDFKAGQILWAGELINIEPRANGVLKAITAPA
jgi:hypothetical protein